LYKKASLIDAFFFDWTYNIDCIVRLNQEATMLQIIREKFTGPIAFAVIAAIGITLVISFGNMDTGGATGNFAAEVNGEEIPILNYQRLVQNELGRQQETFQGEFPEALQEQLRRNVPDYGHPKPTRHSHPYCCPLDRFCCDPWAALLSGA
jgi:hypothetical protein